MYAWTLICKELAKNKEEELAALIADNDGNF